MWNTDHFFEKIETRPGIDYMLRTGEGVPDQGVYIRPHVHLENEIMWFHHASGFFSIGSEKFKIKENTLVFVNSMILHDMELSHTANHQRFLLQYDDAMINRLKYKFPFAGSHAGFVMQLQKRDAERIQFLFTWLAELHEGTPAFYESDPLLIVLLNLVITLADEAEKVIVSDEKNNTFDHIIGFVVEVERNKTFSITLDEAAAKCNLSSSHFSRTFKKIMQISFKEYLIRKKVAQSADLLRNTDLSITEIAYQTEFIDASYFCFKFRKIMGVTPSTFREYSRTTQQLSTRHDKS